MAAWRFLHGRTMNWLAWLDNPTREDLKWLVALDERDKRVGALLVEPQGATGYRGSPLDRLSRELARI